MTLMIMLDICILTLSENLRMAKRICLIHHSKPGKDFYILLLKLLSG